jgi:hypothetical protein
MNEIIQTLTNLMSDAMAAGAMAASTTDPLDDEAAKLDARFKALVTQIVEIAQPQVEINVLRFKGPLSEHSPKQLGWMYHITIANQKGVEQRLSMPQGEGHKRMKIIVRDWQALLGCPVRRQVEVVTSTTQLLDDTENLHA